MLRPLLVCHAMACASASIIVTPQPKVQTSPRNAARLPKMAIGAACGATWIAGTVSVGALPAVFVVQNLEPWYASLKKPTWSPPNNIFAPVWSTLYALIGFSCARTLGPRLAIAPQPALAVYIVQAVLNLSWAPIFFGAHRLRLAFFVSCTLLASAGVMAIEFAKASGMLSAGLLAPYLAWLTFATALNFRLWQLNGPHPA